MALRKKLFTPWSSLDNMMGKLPDWWPEEEQQRIAAYEKYDQMYWNDPTQYALRVLENEQPLYIPNARRIVDTTAHYLLKGLTVGLTKASTTEQQWLDAWVKRERFYSKFHQNKQAGVARGDWAFHIVANPNKLEGTRVSMETLHPGMVWKVTDPDDDEKVIRIHVVQQYVVPDDEQKRIRLRKLTYEKEFASTEGGVNKIWREEAIWELEPKWYGPEPKKVTQVLPREQLPEPIDEFPVFWYRNIDWQSQLYGSSELRGLEFLEWAVSQGATDLSGALALEGLGVYATDGGRPVNDNGDEESWEVAPGKVMEVPQGSYFRRVEGVTSITPGMEQINYLEKKMFEATGLSDVALGNVDVQTAESGIALAIKFMPTLAKIEHRDTAGVEITQQMMFNLQKWFIAYESHTVGQDYTVKIAESKLPVDRDARVNELNNMLDRNVISIIFYRSEMEALGYTFPADIDTQIENEIQKKLERQQILAGQNTPPGDNLPPESNTQNGSQPRRANRSNNRNRSNESAGTESGQTLRRQARGGTSRS